MFKRSVFISRNRVVLEAEANAQAIKVCTGNLIGLFSFLTSYLGYLNFLVFLYPANTATCGLHCLNR